MSKVINMDQPICAALKTPTLAKVLDLLGMAQYIHVMALVLMFSSFGFQCNVTVFGAISYHTLIGWYIDVGHSSSHFKMSDHCFRLATKDFMVFLS